MTGLVAGDGSGWSCSKGGWGRVAQDGTAVDSMAKPANSNRPRRVRARALLSGSWLLWLGLIFMALLAGRRRPEETDFVTAAKRTTPPGTDDISHDSASACMTRCSSFFASNPIPGISGNLT